MFPAFDNSPQHAETVGARKARKAKEGVTSRRGSSSTTQSSGSTSTKTEKRSVFGWAYRKKNKDIQEISALPPVKKSQPFQEPVLEPEPEAKREPSPSPSPSPSLAPLQDSLASLHIPRYDGHRRPPQRSYSPGAYQDQSPHQQHYAPPLRTLPTPPPSGALPQPPPSPGLEPSLRGRIDTRRPGPVRLQSQISHASLSPSTTSSERTAFSNRSVFSGTSGSESAISEESYGDPRYASNLQLEPVERSDSRSGSSLGERGAKAAQTPFGRALAKMESASARIVTARLSEEWERLDDDESYQEVVFEKRLWALTAYQRLTQNKHLQSPAHEMLSSSRPADQRRILHLHGSLADGWMLATCYPSATVYTTSSMTSFTSPTSYPAPLNHHCLYVPSPSTAMPFPDGYFDAIVSRSVSTVLRNEEWAGSFFDYKRVLKPGGQIEILSVDAHLSSEGHKLSSWVDEHIVGRLEAHGMSKLPSDTLLDTMEIVGLEKVRRARVALPASLGAPKARPNAAAPLHPPPQAAAPSQDIADTIRMMAFLGRHFYEDMYSTMMQAGQSEEWFWSRKDIRDECERHQTKMVLTIACAQKPSGPALGESYHDI